jgi:hypothetical protein
LSFEQGFRKEELGTKKPWKLLQCDTNAETQQAVTDIPCILFADELIAAYPNAKVVLNTRDPDKWLQSMGKTFYVIMSWKSMAFLGPLDIVRNTSFTSPVAVNSEPG